MSRHEWLQVAQSAALAAGKMAHEQWTQPRQIMSKGFRNTVTEIDFAAQEMIMAHIRAHFPDHLFLAEEEVDSADLLPPSTDLTTIDKPVWIIDPIDGTTNYSHQLPAYCISVALAVAGEVQVGVIYHPPLDELFWAVKDGGSYLGKRQICVSEIDDLGQALVAYDWSRSPHNRAKVLATLNHLAHQSRTPRTVGAAALTLCWIACGRIEGYFNYQLNAWDIAAGMLILTEAQGKTSAIDQTPASLAKSNSWTVSSNGHIHADLCSLIKT